MFKRERRLAWKKVKRAEKKRCWTDKRGKWDWTEEETHELNVTIRLKVIKGSH